MTRHKVSIIAGPDDYDSSVYIENGDGERIFVVECMNKCKSPLPQVAAQALDLYVLTGKTPFELMSAHCPEVVAEWCRDVNKKADRLYSKMTIRVNNEIKPGDLLMLESKLDAISKILEPAED